MNIAQALALRGEVDSYERQENAWLLAEILQCSTIELKIKLAQTLTQQQQRDYLQALERIKAGEPLAYVIGSQPFWALDLKVSKDTLVPRPDTEILVETALKLPLVATANILDLGTGSGAIALSLAVEHPMWNVVATDIEQATLAIAQENAIKYNLTNVTFYLGSWYQAILSPQKFDLIVSNPPYIADDDPHVVDLHQEPYRALVSAQQGLADLNKIINEAPQWLQNKGWLIVEHGYNQALDVQRYFQQANFQQIRTLKDYGGNERITLGQWNIE